MKKIFLLVFLIAAAALLLTGIMSEAEAATKIAAPSDLKAEAVSDSSIKLTWTDNSDNEDIWLIYCILPDSSVLYLSYNSNTGGSTGDTVSYTVNDKYYIKPASVYYFYVRAFSVISGEKSDPSNKASATTLPKGMVKGYIVLPPAAPSNLKTTTVTESSVDLSWTDNANNEKGFKIFRKAAGGSYSEIAAVNADVTGYSDKNVQSLKTYYYKVCTYNENGNSIFSNEVSAFIPLKVFITSPPAAPSNLTATVTEDPHVKLSWADNSSIETGFKIFRKEQGGNYKEIDTVGADVTAYTDGNITAGNAYYYKIRAFNSHGDSAFTKELPVNTTIPSNNTPNTGAPAAPSDLQAFAISDSQVELNWKDNFSTEDGFKIQRKEGSGTFKTIDTIGAGNVVYIDKGLSPGSTYSYRVCAYNANGDSNFSGVANATLQGQGPANPEPGNIPHNGAGETAIQLRIGSTEYFVNGKLGIMDASPVIRDGRTLLPIRYVAEPLGASVGWDAGEQRATVALGSKVIKMWIGNNKAVVDGNEELIDPGNSDVAPIILPPGRTMLPLRFVAEALGCEVDWDAQTRTVTVTSGGTETSGSQTTPAPEVWTGTWQTDYGPLKMQQQGDQVTGSYDNDTATISGTVSGNKLIGIWQDPGSSGDLEFTLSADGKSFTGKWRYAGEGAGAWRQWNGTKVK